MGNENERHQKALRVGGEIYKNHTLFLAHSEHGLRDGHILVELNKELLAAAEGDGELSAFEIEIKLSFEDRDGRYFDDAKRLVLQCDGHSELEADDAKEGENEDFYDTVGIRKSILLHRYVKIIKQR